MNEKKLKKYIARKEKGVFILTWTYLILIMIIYLMVSMYISDGNRDELSLYQSIVPLIVTSLIGSFSKGYFFSLVDLIFDNYKELVTDKVERNNRKVEGIVNFLTIVLFLRFLADINNHENIFLTIGIVASSFLIFLYVIAIYFKFEPLTKQKK